MKHFSILLLFFCVLCADRPVTITRGDVIVHSHIQQIPDAFPENAIYPGAKIRHAALFTNQERWAQPQSMASFESPSTMSEIEDFYRKFLKDQDWKIIQSRKESDSILLMAESDYRKLMTVIIRTGDPFTTIRIYFKRSGS